MGDWDFATATAAIDEARRGARDAAPDRAGGRAAGRPAADDAQDRVRGATKHDLAPVQALADRQLATRGLAGGCRRPGVARAAAADGDRAARAATRTASWRRPARRSRRATSTPADGDARGGERDARRGGRRRAASGSRSRAWPGPASSRSAARRVFAGAARPADGREAAGGGRRGGAGAEPRRRRRRHGAGRRRELGRHSRHRLRRSRSKRPPAAPDGPDPYATLGDPRPAGGEPDPTGGRGARRRRRNVRRLG